MCIRAHSAPIEWRRVDEVEPAFERHAHALQHLFERDVAKLRTKRTRAEAEDGKLQVGVAETPGRNHCGLGIADGGFADARKCSKNAKSCSFDSCVGECAGRLLIATRSLKPRRLL